MTLSKAEQDKADHDKKHEHGAGRTAKERGEDTKKSKVAAKRAEPKTDAEKMNAEIRAGIKAEAKKESGHAYYKINAPAYRLGVYSPAGSVVTLPIDEDPSVDWEPVTADDMKDYKKDLSGDLPKSSASSPPQNVNEPKSPFIKPELNLTEKTDQRIIANQKTRSSDKDI